MAVETLSGEYAAVVGPGHGISGNVKSMFGRYNWGTVVVEDGDIRLLFKLPANVLVIGGRFWAGDLDTGTETIDIDIGWAANGGGSATYTDSRANYTFTNSGASASATGFVNSGVLTGDAITDFIAAGINHRPFPMTTGPLYFSHETQVQAEVNAPSATPADAQMWVFIDYIQL